MQVVEVDSILYTCAYCSQIRQKKVNDGGGGGHFDMKLMNRLTLIIFRLCCKFFMQVNVINCCVQVLVACTPDGVLCYISRVYGGAASDKFITTDCGFLEHLQKGDQIMADKGFDIHDEVEKRGAALNLPPFRNPGKTQFEEDEVTINFLID